MLTSHVVSRPINAVRWAAKHMRGFAIGMIFVATFLAGCAPTVIKGYVPSSEVGELVFYPCEGQTHIPRGVRFVRNGTQVETTLIPYRDTHYLHVRITPTPSTRVQLGEHAAQLYLGTSTQGYTVAFENIGLTGPSPLAEPPYVSSKTMGIDSPMVGERYRVGKVDKNEYDKNFWLAAKLETSEAESIGLMLPTLVMNGETVKFPMLRFKYESRAGFVLMGC